jgi:hypothetical protein
MTTHPMLTDKHRAEADRRDSDGAITSLTVARELYRRQIDREYADRLVMAVYLRGLELGNHKMIDAAMDLAIEKGFASRLAPPLTMVGF